MYKITEEDFHWAMEEASKYFGVDPAYYGEEGEEKVRELLKSRGYTEEDLGDKKWD